MGMVISQNREERTKTIFNTGLVIFQVLLVIFQLKEINFKTICWNGILNHILYT